MPVRRPSGPASCDTGNAPSSEGGRSLLLVDPRSETQGAARRLLAEHGYEVATAGSDATAHAILQRHKVQLVLLDLPDGPGGWKTLDLLRARHPTVPIIVTQSVGQIETATEALRRGAVDYLSKPFEPASLIRSVRRALGSATSIHSPEDADLIERSLAMRGLMDQVRLVAPSDSNVLLTGETGVGKEMVARYIHEISPRSRREFVAINCASLADDMLENELFGHERGAFTSANERKAGVFELADGGTLFLDEIAEMSLPAQAKLLRAIERKEFRRLGGTKKVTVDIRILAAANVDLRDAMSAGRFRSDLFYRLSVVALRVPPLRERREVIPELVEYFLRRFGQAGEGHPQEFSAAALARLIEYDWPGNVRELRNVVERLTLTAPGPRVETRDLPPEIRKATATPELRIPIGLPMEHIEREIFRAYINTYGSKKAAAKALGIALRTFHAKTKRYELAPRPSHTSPRR